MNRNECLLSVDWAQYLKNLARLYHFSLQLSNQILLVVNESWIFTFADNFASQLWLQIFRFMNTEKVLSFVIFDAKFHVLKNRGNLKLALISIEIFYYSFFQVTYSDKIHTLQPYFFSRICIYSLKQYIFFNRCFQRNFAGYLYFGSYFESCTTSVLSSALSEILPSSVDPDPYVF